MDTKDKKALGQRIASIRGQQTVGDFADVLAVHKNTLTRYEAGTRIPDAIFMAALARLGVNLHWLVTGQGSPKVLVSNVRANLITDQSGPGYETGQDADDYVRVGELRSADDTTLQPVKAFAFKRAWLVDELGLDPVNLCLVQAQGDSMAPLVNHEDWVLVDTRPHHAERPREGNYLLRLSGNLLVRRLEVLPGKRYKFRPCNENYSELELDAASLGQEDFIIGRAVWMGQKLV